MERVVINISGMSCQGCVRNITGVLQEMPGVSEVVVSLEAGQAEITYDPKKNGPAEFREVIEDAGFDVV